MAKKKQDASGGKSRASLRIWFQDFRTGRTVAPKNLDSNMLAVDRTRLAHERTMMSWIRTGLSLISFGFTIYKFFQILGAGSPGQGRIGAKAFGGVMIVIGLFAVLLASFQYRREIQGMRAAGIEVPPSMATIIGALVSLLGIFGLLALLFRM
jgi:putative membrane protein